MIQPGGHHTNTGLVECRRYPSLPGTLDWDGVGDMLIAVGEGTSCWVAPREGLREAKEALRRRLYRTGEREVRDRVLAAMSRRFEAWRRDETA